MTPLFRLLIALVLALFMTSVLIGPAAVGTLASLKALMLGGDGPLPIVMRQIRLCPARCWDWPWVRGWA